MLDIFYRELAEIYRLSCAQHLLEWDQQVMLPPLGAAERAEQLELLSRLVHQRMVAPHFVDVVSELYERREELSPDDLVNVRETHRSVERRRKLPETFVAERAKLAAVTYTEWTKARPNSDFKQVRPHLERMIQLCREECKLVGFAEHPYDALLDEYEPGAKLREVKPLLVELGERIARSLPEIVKKSSKAATQPLPCPEALQHAICLRVLADIGYSMQWGRLDKTHHPFQTSLGPQDFRVTTRYDEGNLLSSLFTALHEGGHALYEAGIPKRWQGTPLGCPVSLGVHESQSRLWENLIGRSHAFSRYLFNVLAEVAPELHKQTSPEALWASSNHIEPSLIRVEADEVTYSLHVVIRMLLEERIIADDLQVAELPQAWDDMYERFLGIRSKTLKDGVLQDVHWYSGLVGYFPTYALGNIYGACLLEKIRTTLPTLDDDVARGEFAPLLTWLGTNIHAHGMRYQSKELVEHATGAAVTSAPFISYLQTKFEVDEALRHS